MTGAVGGMGTGVRVAVTATRLVAEAVVTTAVLTATVVFAAVVVVFAGAVFAAVTLGAATRVTFVVPNAAVAVKNITLPAASAHKTVLILDSLGPPRSKTGLTRGIV
jgi:hypothetical protein